MNVQIDWKPDVWKEKLRNLVIQKGTLKKIYLENIRKKKCNVNVVITSAVEHPCFSRGGPEFDVMLWGSSSGGRAIAF